MRSRKHLFQRWRVPTHRRATNWRDELLAVWGYAVSRAAPEVPYPPGGEG